MEELCETAEIAWVLVARVFCCKHYEPSTCTVKFYRQKADELKRCNIDAMQRWTFGPGDADHPGSHLVLSSRFALLLSRNRYCSRCVYVLNREDYLCNKVLFQLFWRFTDIFLINPRTLWWMRCKKKLKKIQRRWTLDISLQCSLHFSCDKALFYSIKTNQWPFEKLCTLQKSDEISSSVHQRTKIAMDKTSSFHPSPHLLPLLHVEPPLFSNFAMVGKIFQILVELLKKIFIFSFKECDRGFFLFTLVKLSLPPFCVDKSILFMQKSRSEYVAIKRLLNKVWEYFLPILWRIESYHFALNNHFSSDRWIFLDSNHKFDSLPYKYNVYAIMLIKRDRLSAHHA